MSRHRIAMAVALCALSCHPAQTPTRANAVEKERASDDKRGWAGVYASTSEIRGFSGTVLVLKKDSEGEVHYREHSHHDVSTAGSIEQDEERGTCLIEGRTIFVPRAYGFMNDGKPVLLANIDRFTFMEVNGRKVLMRDAALRAFRDENKLYDYGILVKVSED